MSRWQIDHFTRRSCTWHSWSCHMQRATKACLLCKLCGAPLVVLLEWILTGEKRCPRWTAKTCSLADLGCGSNQRKCCTGEKSLLIASGPGEWRGPAFATFLRLVVTVQFLQSWCPDNGCCTAAFQELALICRRKSASTTQACRSQCCVCGVGRLLLSCFVVRTSLDLATFFKAHCDFLSFVWEGHKLLPSVGHLLRHRFRFQDCNRVIPRPFANRRESVARRRRPLLWL